MTRTLNPPAPAGCYRLPHAVRERLMTALARFRNREAALALAVFLARHWSTPSRLALTFPVDRRGLADHADLGLSEHQVRAARDALETVGFLEREEPAPGTRFRRTAEGPQRKPILFRFGSDYAPDFMKANAGALAARRRQEGARRQVARSNPPRPSVAVLAHPVPVPVTHKQTSAGNAVLMGGLPRREALPSLEAALARLGKAVEK